MSRPNTLEHASLHPQHFEPLTERMVQMLVTSELGPAFIEPPPFNLQLCYNDSTVKTALIFVFTPGSDPASDLYAFASVMKMERKLEAISLGQGQGPIAEALIKNGQDAGGWVFLQVGVFCGGAASYGLLGCMLAHASVTRDTSALVTEVSRS